MNFHARCGVAARHRLTRAVRKTRSRFCACSFGRGGGTRPRFRLPSLLGTTPCCPQMHWSQPYMQAAQAPVQSAPAEELHASPGRALHSVGILLSLGGGGSRGAKPAMGRGGGLAHAGCPTQSQALCVGAARGDARASGGGWAGGEGTGRRRLHCGGVGAQHGAPRLGGNPCPVVLPFGPRASKPTLIAMLGPNDTGRRTA